ncbi:maltase A3-like [Chironomus tepperi]|uniref:maltase A3-like n=1 Tax=Chironomus tepperi TaxID=113505 RepID=UPI00391FA26E
MFLIILCFDSRYGTKQDFSDLIKAIREKGMKIIVDFVPNHCGYEHKFFQAALNGNKTYDNWFVWGRGTGVNETNPPSNWQRIGGPVSSGWNRHINGVEIARKEYFYAQFYWNMPDFNFREYEVRQYFEKFLRTWLDFGLDGFRVDAISHGYEKATSYGSFPDEPVNEGVTDPNDFGFLDHIYTQDQPELFDLIYRWREILNEYNETRIMMTESYSAPKTIMKFYRSADGRKEGAHLPFNFEFIRSIRRDSKAADFVNVVTNWFNLLPEGEVTNWAIGNHDQSRVATRFGEERVDIFNTLVTMLPGTSVTYYGEEIGMEDSCVFYDQNHNNPGFRCTDLVRPVTDAKYRTPMQWDNSTNGGFTNSSRPWLPIGDKYATVNVAAQTGVAGSHLEIYRSLQKMRKHNAIRNSNLKNFKIVAMTENSFGFKREVEDVKQGSVLVLINYGDRNESVTLDKLELFGSPKEVSLKIVGRKSSLKIDSKMSINGTFVLAPYESIVAIYNHGMAAVVSNMLLIAMILGLMYFNL